MTNSTGPDTAGSEKVAGLFCGSCAHLRSEHDEIAARYCAATLVGKSVRGCVCVPRESAGMAVE